MQSSGVSPCMIYKGEGHQGLILVKGKNTYQDSLVGA